MTADHIRRLHAEWLETTAIPPGIDLRSRRIREAGRARVAEWDFLRCPDYGNDIARRLLYSGRTFSLLDEPPYRWVRKAVEHLGTYGKPPSSDPGLLAVCEANALKKSEDARIIVQAALLASDATPEAVAAAVGLAPPVVDAYATLFFDVLDRKNEPGYIQVAVEAALTRAFWEYDARNVNEADKCLLLTGLNGTVADVMALARSSGRSSAN